MVEGSKDGESLKDYVLKCRMASDYMKLINHAKGCYSNTCDESSCGTIKVILAHVNSCSQSACTTVGCSQTKKLLVHDAQCRSSSSFCLICSLVYQKDIGNAPPVKCKDHSIMQKARRMSMSKPLNVAGIAGMNNFRRRKSASMDDADDSLTSPVVPPTVDTEGFVVPSLLPKRFRQDLGVGHIENSKPRFNSFHATHLPLSAATAPANP